MAGSALLALEHELDHSQHPSFDLAEITKMYDFTGMVVAVTGGAGILGSEIAQALAGCGAQVAILDINVEPVKELVEHMGERGKQFSLFRCDVLNRDSIAQAAQEVVNRFGKIDCLINGAGGNKPTATTSDQMKFFDLPTDALRWVFE
jgi:NAD(P)-dependent dehydrogenase (short-subunit alcohol dehydrogenase family)